jgi:hypothetical protein
MTRLRSLGIAASMAVVVAVAPAPTSAQATLNAKAESANLRGCVDNHNIRMISFEHADSFLPPGFKSHDADVILFNWTPGGASVPQGRSAAVSPGLVCEWSDWEQGPIEINWIVIPIGRPTVTGLEVDSSYIDLYLVTYLTSGAKTRARFKRLGYPTFEAATESGFTFGPPSPIGTARTVDDAGTLADYTVAGAVPVRSAFHVRVWFQTPKGLGFFTWDRSESTVLVGHLPTCSLRPRSTHAQVFGTTDCSAAGPSPGDSIGALFSEPTDFEGDFRFLPGVRPV